MSFDRSDHLHQCQPSDSAIHEHSPLPWLRRGDSVEASGATPRRRAEPTSSGSVHVYRHRRLRRTDSRLRRPIRDEAYGSGWKKTLRKLVAVESGY